MESYSRMMFSSEDLEAKNPFEETEKNLVAELQKLDLTFNEARILLYLLTHGSSTASEISQKTGVHRTETYQHISKLLAKGIVFGTFDRPQKYYSHSIEEVVDSLIEAKKNSLRVFSEKKTEYQTLIEKLLQNKVPVGEESGKDSYQVLMGRDAINSKIKRIFSKAEKSITLLLSDRNLVNLYHAELTDKLVELTKKGVHVNLQTSCKNFAEYIQVDDSKSSSNMQMKQTSDTAESLPVNFIIVDNKELVILFDNAQSGAASSNSKRDTSAFYTSNAQMVATFRFMSENLV